MTEDSSPADELSRAIRRYEMRMAYLNNNISVWQGRFTELQIKVQAALRLAGMGPDEGEPDPSRLSDEILRLRRQIEDTK
jgi:hypothetical protein